MQNSGQIFTGVMDTDSDPRLVTSEDYQYAIDILNGYGERPGAAVFPKGNTHVVLPLPDGTNTCIGTCEDKQNAALFAFFSNDSNDHCIARWGLTDNVVTLVARGEALAFATDKRITHAHVVDGRLLYWTDAVEAQLVVDGNPPRKINTQKGDLFKEAITYELYAGLENSGQFANGSTYRFSIIDWNGDESEINEYTADGAHENDPAAGLEWLRVNLENDYDYPDATFEACDGCKIKMSLPQGNDGRRLNLETSDSDVLLVPINTYPLTLEEHHFDLLKQPPHCAPTAQYFNDPARPTNYVKNLCAQFRVRYIYDDAERSAWGPVSNIALNTGVDGEPVTILNGIEIDFTDLRLSDPSWLSVIRAVDIAFRDGNENDWRLIGRYDVCEIGIQRQVINFYNEASYSTVASDETSTDVNLQVLKPFDYVPIRSLDMAVAADPSGNNLLFLGANQENYDNPDCVTMNLEAVPAEDDCLVDIIGTVTINNDSNFPDDNPDFESYPLGGIVLYLAGTGFYAISNNPADGTGDGSFRISGVPNGKTYILRAASFRCSFTNENGARCNMSNGYEWQRTSAPTIDMASGTCPSERMIDLSAHAGGDFDLDSEAGYGIIQVANQHYARRVIAAPPGADSVNLYEYHVLDNNFLNADNDDRIAAWGCERQKVLANARSTGVGSDEILETDHNGYCFDRRFHPSGTAIISGTIPVNENDYHPAFADRVMYNGGFKELYADTLTIVANTNSTLATQQYLIVNEAEDFTALKKSMKVRALIQDNVTPLPGVLFVYQRNGRQAYTGIDGYAIIPFFPPYTSGPDREDDYLVSAYLPDKCNDGPADPDKLLIEAIAPIDEPFLVDDFIFGFSSIEFEHSRYLKGGGDYSFGILYEDRGNRTPGAIFGAKISIPAHINGLTKWQVEWEVNHLPPIWATHYRIVRLLNGIHSVYVQWKVKSVKYVRIPSQLEAPIETTYADGDYTHLLLQLYTPVVTDPDADPVATLFFQQDGQQGYVPRLGDKVRFLLDEMAAPVNTANLTYETDIVGIYVDGEETYAIVPAVFGSLQVVAGYLAEYYTPVTANPEIYYEGGEDCYDIGEPGTDVRYHKGPLQDQVDGVQPARGLYTGGDTYWRRQKFTETGVYETEHQTPHRYITSRCEDIGRPFALSTDVQQEFYYNRVRVSGTFIANSSVNGLSAFAALEYKDLNRQWGVIKYLGFVNNVMLAICQFKVQPIYIGKGELLYLSGETSVGRSDQIMEIADESVTDYGTHDPASVVIEGASAYFYDRFQGVVCRYAQNGVVPIIPKMSNYFQAVGHLHMTTRGDAIAGFDRQHMMYLLTLTGLEDGDVTLGYDEVKGGWSSYFSFVPEAYGRVGLELVTFKETTLEDDTVVSMWLHHKNDLRANFYGTQGTPAIKWVANQGPSLTKLFKSLRIVSNKKWAAPVIEVPAHSDYLQGMLSRLKENHFYSYEGQWRADFLRDMNDTDAQFAVLASPQKELSALLRGRDLRGEYMIITIEAVDGSEDTEITRADVYFIPSSRSHQ